MIGNRDEYAKTLIDAGPAFAMVSNETVLGVAGVWEVEDHRAIAWAIIDRNIGSDYIHYHKAVLKFLKESNYMRVEMAVDTTFDEGKRWAKMLGFKMEGLMENYFADGNSAYMYGRVKQWQQ